MNALETLSALGSLGEFIGSIAVLATLLYLVIQIRETRKAAQAAVIWERARAARDMGMLWSTNLQVAELMQEFGQTTEAEFDAKSAESRARAFQYLALNRAVAENMQALYLTAEGNAERQAVRDRLATLVRIPGFRWTWPHMNTPGAFSDEFVAVYDDALRTTLAAHDASGSVP